jgi:hypothetical protein
MGSDCDIFLQVHQKHKLTLIISFKVKSPSILFYFHENTFLSVWQNLCPYSHDLLLRMHKVYSCRKNVCCHMRILTDSARKRNRKEVLANKMNCELMLTYDTPALRQTGSRNLTGPKMLPTIWGTYKKLVTKYQISVINSCWEKCD